MRTLAALAVVLFLTASVVVTRGPWAEGIQVSDVPDYELYGEAMASGDVPYRDVAIEYPPGAIVAFLAPAIVADGEAEYARAFAWLMRLCGVALLLLTAISLRAIGSSSGRAVVALGVIALSPLLVGRVMLQRYDLLPAAMTALALTALLLRRDRLAFGALALAVGTKLYPVVMLPCFLMWVWTRRGKHEAILNLLVFAGVLVAMVVPFAVVGFDGVMDAFSQQAGRPLNRETTAGAVLLVLHQLSGLKLESARSHGSTNFVGELPDALALVSVVLQALALGWLLVVTVRSRMTTELLIGIAATAVLMFVVLGKVLSPQFLIWLLPLVPLVGGRRWLISTGLLAVAMALTQAYFPRRYLALSDLDAAPSWIIAGRNVTLLVLLVIVARSVQSHRPGPDTQPRHAGAPV